MPSLHQLVVRDDNTNDSNLTPTMIRLLIALVVLLVTAIILITGLLIFRYVKSSKKASRYEHAPYASEKHISSTSNYRRLTVDTYNTTPAYAFQEKRALMESMNSPPASPGVPEIRITFPDEVDTTGRPQSGRVVVVRMGENNAMGLEPVEDSAPPYEKETGDRFQSLDLERIGGLKEKDLEKHYS